MNLNLSICVRTQLPSLVAASIALLLMAAGCKRKIEANDEPTIAASGDRRAADSAGCRDQLSIEVPYPGASAIEAEHAVLVALEEAALGVTGVRAVHGFAREGHAQLVIVPEQLDASRVERLMDQALQKFDFPNPKLVREQLVSALQQAARPDNKEVARVLAELEALDLQNLQDDVRAALTRIASLPEAAKQPLFVVEPTKDRFVAVAAFGQLAPSELREWSHALRDRFEREPQIRDVALIGDLRREVIIRADPVRLRKFGLQLGELARAVRQFPLDAQSSMLQRTPEMLDIEELGRVELASPGPDQLRLADVAQIDDGFVEQPAVRVGGDRAVILLVRPRPDLLDSDLSALVSRVATATSHPDGKVIISRPIAVSRCQIGAPLVSGKVAVIDVSGDATAIEKIIPASVSGDASILLLEGTGLFGAKEPANAKTQVISFPEDDTTAARLVRSWQEAIAALPGMSTVVLAPPTDAVTVNFDHSDGAVLDRAATQLQAALRTRKEVSSITRYPSGEKPEMNIQVRGEALAHHGVTALDVARLVRNAIYGDTVGRFRDGRDEVVVNLRLGDEVPASAEQILQLEVTTPGGAVVPLGQLVSLNRQISPAEIYRYGGRRRHAVRIVADSEKGAQELRVALEAKILRDLRDSAPGLRVSVGD